MKGQSDRFANSPIGRFSNRAQKEATIVQKSSAGQTFEILNDPRPNKARAVSPSAEDHAKHKSNTIFTIEMDRSAQDEDESMQEDSLLDPDSSYKKMQSFETEHEEEQGEDLDRHDRPIVTTSLPISVSGDKSSSSPSGAGPN